MAALTSSHTILLNGKYVAAELLRVRAVDFQQDLACARKHHGHALCMCRRTGLPLVIRQRGGIFHLASWPDQAHAHSPDCPFYSTPQQYTKRSAVAALSTESAQTVAAYHQPWIARRNQEHSAHSGVKLWALVHHLWESSRLHSWSHGWMRNWSMARKVLMRAAASTVVNHEPLADHLYIPPPYSAKQQKEIESGWQKFVMPLKSHCRGGPETATAFILGSVRKLTKNVSGLGYTLRLRHHLPGILIGEAMAKNLAQLCRRGWMELIAADNENGPGPNVIALLRVEAMQDGAIVAADCVLMRTTSRWMPSNCPAEDFVADALMDDGREFIRPLSYSQATLDLPAFVLHDEGNITTELHVFGAGMSSMNINSRRRMHEEDARSRKVKLWFWDRSQSRTMPPLPTPKGDAK